MAMAPFIWGAGGEQLTPQQVERRRIAALLQSQRASDTSPVGHWTQAAARGLNGFLAGRGELNADRQETAGLASADMAIQGNPVLSALMGGQQMPGMTPAPQGAGPVPSAPMAQGGADPTLDLIREFEGFRETPYWDVNAHRTGYGSDTITAADGSVIPVREGMQVSREDAERDLQRRVSTEFEPRAMAAAGPAWDSLAPQQKAALTSIAYNYGSVPEPVANALQGGGDVASAIMSLSGHNDGINADRRRKEAELFAGMASPGGGGVMGNTPQAPSGVVAALAAAQSNPWVAQKYGPVINALMDQEMGRQDASYQQQMRQSDPMYQAQLEAAQIGNMQAMNPVSSAPASFQALDMQAQAAGLQPGTEPYQQFMLNGGAGGSSAPAAFQALDMQAQAAGFIPGTPEYREFMASRGAGYVAQASAQGAARGDAIVGMDSAIQSAERSIANLQQIRDDPNLSSITGMVQGRLPPMTQGGTDLNTRIQQAQGAAFLEAFESLKGGGAITEIEGTKAEQAMARLNRTQSEDAYKEALNELIDVLNIGMSRARSRAGQPAEAAAPATAATPARRRYNPETGAFE